MSEFAEENVFKFKPIPGFSDQYLVRVNNSLDNLGLLRAIGIMINRSKSSPCSYTYARSNPKRHIYIGKEMLEWVETLDQTKDQYNEEILPTVQEFLNNCFGIEKYNIILFDGNETPTYKLHRSWNREIFPIFEGNPKGKYLISILRYEMDGKFEFCGIPNIGRAFSSGVYCVKCKHTFRNLKNHLKNECEKTKSEILYSKFLLPPEISSPPPELVKETYEPSENRQKIPEIPLKSESKKSIPETDDFYDDSVIFINL